MTRRALDRLAQSGAAFRYAATSPDGEQAARLRFAVSAAPGASAACWRPGEPTDALDEDRFDIILAAHAGARLRLDTASLAALRDLLVPGGLMIAVEPEPNPLWDLVFGRGSEWWRGADAGAGESPLRCGGDWRVELAIAGFEATGAARRRGRAVADLRVLGTGAERPATGQFSLGRSPSRGPAKARRVCRSR